MRRVLHGQLRAQVAVDPLHRRALLGDGALGDQVVDVGGPVLDGRVADLGAGLGDDLDHRRVQRVGGVDGSGAALDVVHVRALLGDDQGALELAHVLGVDPEVGLEGHLDLDARGHVDERAAGPDGRVEGRELVVVGRDHGGPVLAHDVLVLAQRGVHVHEDHALLLEVLADLVVDDLGLVLGADAGQELALRLGDAEPVEGLLDVLGHLVPAAAVLLRGADEVVDVVEVDLAEVAAPGGGRARCRKWSSALRRNSRIHSGSVLYSEMSRTTCSREALRRLVGVAGLGIMEAEPLGVVGADVLERRAPARSAPCRATGWACVSGVAMQSLLNLQLHFAVLDSRRERLDGLVGGERLRPAASAGRTAIRGGGTPLYRRRGRTPPRPGARRRGSSGPRSRRARRRRSGRRRPCGRPPRPGASSPRGARPARIR